MLAGHTGFAGTVSISAKTLIAVVTDVAESLHRSGIDRLAIVNGHGGNYVLSNIVQQANVGGPWMTLFPGRTEWDTARAAARLQTATSEDMHAGELEVSLLLHAYPELVSDDFHHGDWQADDRPHLLVTGMRGYTESGVIGRPSLATAEKDALSSTAWRGPSRTISRCCYDFLYILKAGPAGGLRLPSGPATTTVTGAPPSPPLPPRSNRSSREYAASAALGAGYSRQEVTAS